MDLNAMFNAAVEQELEAKKSELIKQTIEEEHDYLRYKFDKIFDNAYVNLDDVLNKYKIKENISNKLTEVLNILIGDIINTISDETDNENTSVEDDEYNLQPEEDDWDGDAAQTEFYNTPMYTDEKEDTPVLTDNDTIVTVDNEKRIIIPVETLDAADYPLIGTVKILKDENTNTVYIVNSEVFDKTKTFIKYRDLDDGVFRIGVGGLLGVQAGDLVLVKVVDTQVITLSKLDGKTAKKESEFLYEHTVMVTKDNRITIPNFVLADAGLEEKELYIKVSEEGEVLISHDDIEDWGVGEVKLINKTRFANIGESLRLGIGSLLNATEGDEIGIDVYNNSIILHY